MKFTLPAVTLLVSASMVNGFVVPSKPSTFVSEPLHAKTNKNQLLDDIERYDAAQAAKAARADVDTSVDGGAAVKALVSQTMINSFYDIVPI